MPRASGEWKLSEHLRNVKLERVEETRDELEEFFCFPLGALTCSSSIEFRVNTFRLAALICLNIAWRWLESMAEAMMGKEICSFAARRKHSRVDSG
jgi:hypothetical protein